MGCRAPYIGDGADFCAVRGSLKTPGPIKISWELFLALTVVLATRRPPAYAGLGGFTKSRPIVEPPHLIPGLPRPGD
jgi:hypothetical protein